jgi:SAM-dependent methyltransferase
MSAKVTAGEYTPDYFRVEGANARRSATVVVPRMIELIHPLSVVDVGCGTGEWLAVFGQFGVEDTVGIDAPWVPRHQLQIPTSAFVERDLTRAFRMDRTFDLALCLEVVEHLPPHTADTFIASLANLAPITLFSAAIPFQRGSAHVNERWASYWAERFAAHQFELINCLRSHLWDNPEVEAYYRQNLLLFVHRDRLDSQLREIQEAARLVPIDIVHPEYFIGAQIENVNLRQIPGGVLRSVRRAVRKRIHLFAPTLRSHE